VSVLLTLPFLVPLAATALGLLLRSHHRGQRTVTATMLATLLATGVALVVATSDGAAVATGIGTWPRGLTIVWAADGFSALLLTVTVVMASAAVLFAAARGEDRHPLFHPMVAALLAGVLGSFLTADLFNLFVTFEVMLIASYVLLTLRGGARQVRAGAIYVGVNLLASTLFLLGIALLYGVAGTVDLGALAGVVEDLPPARVGATVVAVAIAVKASLVPLHAWLPRAYVEAGPAVTALFSGLLTKAGVFVLYRLYSVVFAGDPTLRPAILAVAMLTMVVGVLGAVGRGDVRGILAFHMVSQVGYLVLPLGLWTVGAVTAGLVYLLQYIVVKGALFLAAGAIETVTGTGRLKELGGMARTRPLLALGFLLAALALAGIPPTSGFVGKLLLLLAALDAGSYLAAGLIVAVSLFTLLSMVKIWNGVFWGALTPRVRHERRILAEGRIVPAGGAADDDARPASAGATGRVGSVTTERARVAALVAPSLVLGVVVLLLGLAAPWLVDLVEPAARTIVDPTPYLEAVRDA
jgi:multicomponent Na+:H+ antiporter subunit D